MKILTAGELKRKKGMWRGASLVSFVPIFALLFWGIIATFTRGYGDSQFVEYLLVAVFAMLAVSLCLFLRANRLGARYARYEQAYRESRKNRENLKEILPTAFPVPRLRRLAECLAEIRSDGYASVEVRRCIASREYGVSAFLEFSVSGLLVPRGKVREEKVWYWSDDVWEQVYAANPMPDDWVPPPREIAHARPAPDDPSATAT